MQAKGKKPFDGGGVVKWFSILYCVVCTVYSLLSTANWLLSIVHCQLSFVYCLLSTVACLLATVHWSVLQPVTYRHSTEQGSSENDGRSDVYDRSEFKVISNCCYNNCCRTNCSHFTRVYLNLPEFT